jgi:pilus assembly protein FimV
MSRKLILASAVSLALLPGVVAALGLGGIRTQSALNEPFLGEIELLDVKPDELDGVKVLLASPEEFDRAGASRPHFLSRLRFQPSVSRDGRAVIAITSNEPIREPFLDFLVEANWPTGRMVKGYTVLLDPPVMVDRRPPSVERPTTSAPPRSAAVAAEPRPAPARLAAVPPGAGDQAYPVSYGPVGSGKGLWRVARELAPAGATVAQTAMALYRSNQDAFIRGDINKLKVGEVLEIPSADELFALTPPEAERQFGGAMRGERVAAAPLAPAAPPAPAEDRLEIAGATDAGAVPRDVTVPPAPTAGRSPELGSLEAELLLVREASESNRQETEELHARIRDLESQLTDIQRLLSLRNEQLAQIQRMQPGASGLPLATEGELPATTAEPSEGLSPSAAPSAAELTDVPAASGELPSEITEPDVVEVEAAEGEVAAVKPAELEPAAAEPAEVEPAEVEPAPIELTGKPEEAPASPLLAAADEASEPVSLAPPLPALTQPNAPGPDIAARVEPVAGPAPDVAGELWSSWVYSPIGIGAAVVLLGGLFAAAVVQRRRRLEEGYRPAELPLEPALAGIPDSEPASAAIAHPAPAARAPATRRPGQPLAPSTQLSALGDLDDETEEADVVSEADVYIAYGRYREAESLLEGEIASAPHRVDLKYKLAEAYFGARNLPSLKQLVDGMRGDVSVDISLDQWQRLETMVRDLERSSAEGADGLSRPAARAAPESSAGAASFQPSHGDWLSSAVLPDSRRSEPMSGQASKQPASSMPRELELDINDLELVGGNPVTSGGSPPTADMELRLEELERFSEMSLGAGETQGRGASSQAPRGESLDILPAGKDSLASDVLSSQWPMDSGLWDEVATKLDLARAYVEMEDPDAARVILEEVAQEGTADQRAEAKDMLARLS